LRVGLPVVTFRPITGHGRRDAGTLAGLGLTDLLEDETGWHEAVVRLRDDSWLRAHRIQRGQQLFIGDAANAVVSTVAEYRTASKGSNEPRTNSIASSVTPMCPASAHWSAKYAPRAGRSSTARIRVNPRRPSAARRLHASFAQLVSPS
jgi:hypothetical protein